MATDNGGPAFPVAFKEFNGAGDLCDFYTNGMTLLDWFAGQALMRFEQEYHEYEAMAKDCYDIATAMLAEKRRRESEGGDG